MVSHDFFKENAYVWVDKERNRTKNQFSDFFY